MQYGSIQPWDVWLPWKLNPFQAAILKYVVRYKDKNGVEDLEKAKHMLDKLIQLERLNETHKAVPDLQREDKEEPAASVLHTPD